MGGVRDVSLELARQQEEGSSSTEDERGVKREKNGRDIVLTDPGADISTSLLPLVAPSSSYSASSESSSTSSSESSCSTSPSDLELPSLSEVFTEQKQSEGRRSARPW